MPAVYLSACASYARECKCRNAPLSRARVYKRAGEARRYPLGRIKGRTETQLKNHDARVCNVSLSLSWPLSSSGFLRVLLFAPFSPREDLRARPRAETSGLFARRPAMRDDDILFRACYANRELSNAGERPRLRWDKCCVPTLERLQKIKVVESFRP